MTYLCSLEWYRTVVPDFERDRRWHLLWIHSFCFVDHSGIVRRLRWWYFHSRISRRKRAELQSLPYLRAAGREREKEKEASEQFVNLSLPLPLILSFQSKTIACIPERLLRVTRLLLWFSECVTQVCMCWVRVIFRPPKSGWIPRGDNNI